MTRRKLSEEIAMRDAIDQMIAGGVSNNAIARQLGCSIHTVQARRRSLIPVVEIAPEQEITPIPITPIIPTVSKPKSVPSAKPFVTPKRRYPGQVVVVNGEDRRIAIVNKDGSVQLRNKRGNAIDPDVIFLD